MKLHAVRIREFKSIWDSNSFTTDRITCLVGKNEAGKTAILQALYRLNPIIGDDGSFDVTHDYPRADVETYRQDVETGRRRAAVVVEAVFELEAIELAEIANEFGDELLPERLVTISKGYPEEGKTTSALCVNVPIVERRLVQNLVSGFALPSSVGEQAAQKTTLAQLLNFLDDSAARQSQEFSEANHAAAQLEDEAARAAAVEKSKSLAESEQAKALRARLAELLTADTIGLHVWHTILKSYFPKFLYFNEYYQMRGHDNIEALKQRRTASKLKPSDHPLLGLIELARLDLDKILAVSSTQDLKNKLQGASNHLSSQVLRYWSQNKHLRMNFDVRHGLKDDPEGMQEGINIWGEILDSKHLVSTELGSRSTGFVWFFSFLAWYSAVKKKNEPLVLLLDEPGLSLHGRAQEDLLRYFEAEVATNPKHQLLYTTHSPFMVDPQHFERIRIVQDRSIDADTELSREEDGTKVLGDVLEAGPDSLFPLQGALGYDIHQSLFVGPNCLVVEGVSDLLYIQSLSGVLEGQGRTGLDSRWTITPVGGSDKVPTFVALLGAQPKLTIATLIDFQKTDQQTIENLYKRKLLKKSNVHTFADFTGKPEADIEDMFDEDFYVQLVNQEFAADLAHKLKLKDLASHAPRIVVRLEEYFRATPMKSSNKFSHYRPARYLAEKVTSLAIPAATLDRFEVAFRTLNKILR